MATYIEDEEVIDVEHSLVKTQQLPADLMLLKMENESMMAAARVVPRDPMKIVKQLKELIEAYPDAAEEAIYSKPVGSVFQVKCANEKCGIVYEVPKVDRDTICPACDCKEIMEGRDDGPRKIQKFAEGLSVRAAESIRSIFGYTRLATTCELQENGNARLSGTIVDYAACSMTTDERIVSPYYKGRGGQMTRTPEDRFLNVMVKAEKSKLRRDLILDITPGIIKAIFRDECERKMKGLIAHEVIEQKIIPQFATFGLTVEHLEKIVGRTVALGWREEERLLLLKIRAGLKSGEMTVRELLADIDETKGAQQQAAGNTTVGQGGTSAADLTNPTSAPAGETVKAGDQAKEEPKGDGQGNQTQPTEPPKQETTPPAGNTTIVAPEGFDAALRAQASKNDVNFLRKSFSEMPSTTDAQREYINQAADAKLAQIAAQKKAQKELPGS